MKIIDFLNLRKNCPVCNQQLILKVNNNLTEVFNEFIYLRQRPDYSSFINSYNYVTNLTYPIYMTPKISIIPEEIPMANIFTNEVKNVLQTASQYDFEKYNCHFSYSASGYICPTLSDNNIFYFSTQIEQELSFKNFKCLTKDNQTIVSCLKANQQITLPRIDFLDPIFDFTKFENKINKLIILS